MSAAAAASPSGGERRIDVSSSQSNGVHSIDDEFGRMRARFDTEMKRVEDEMRRLRAEFEANYKTETASKTNGINGNAGLRNGGGNLSNQQPSPNPPAPSQTNRTSSSYSSSREERTYASPSMQRSPDPHQTMMSIRPQSTDPHLDNIKSPLIRDESDGRTLRLRFDVAAYLPEEVTVKTVDDRLLVHARHEEKTPTRTVFREYNQEFLLPRGTNPELINSTLSTDGVLTVEAPLPQAAIAHH